jgi:hypothetical protein
MSSSTPRLLLAALCMGPACNVYNADLLSEATAGDSGGGISTGATGGTEHSGGLGGLGPSGGQDAGDSGGSDTGGNPGGGSGGSPSNAPTYELIDDMEDNEPHVLPTRGRNGRWNTYNDGTSEGVQLPPADFTTMTDVRSDAPHESSDYAAYTSGEGFSGFGAVLNVTMRSWPDYEETPPYDATAYSGLSFWAKVGANKSTTIRVRLVTTDTDPRGGECSPSGDVSEICFDHFLTQLTLSTGWQRYDVFFDDFGQTATGKPFSAPNLGGLYTIEFVASGSGPFEFWIDDLSFIRVE